MAAISWRSIRWMALVSFLSYLHRDEGEGREGKGREGEGREGEEWRCKDSAIAHPQYIRQPGKWCLCRDGHGSMLYLLQPNAMLTVLSWL